MPAYTKEGNLIKTNAVLFFKNQIMSAMSESPRLALYSSKLSYLQQVENGVQVLSRLLAWQPIEIKAIGLEAGDKYVDAATGYESEKVVTSPRVIRYSIASIGDRKSVV